jgi:glutamyl endopeptidase
MKQVSPTIGSMVAAIAFMATASPAFSQSKHTPVSNDGSAAPSVEATFSSGSAATSAAPSRGDSRVTAASLSNEGVFFDPESHAEFRGKAALPDAGEAGSVGGDIGAEVILGPDTRERLYTSTYPTRARVLITFTGGRCSGTLIGPNTVATAGHCVHTGGLLGSWRPVSSFRIYPGRDGALSPYGVCTARTLFSVIGWTVSANEEYDYGAVKLNCTVGNTVGWFGFAPTVPVNFPTGIGGYPGDKPLTQWASSDRVRALSLRQLFYRNDTIGGQSGSAVWHDPNGPYIIGIHAYGTHGIGNHALYNHGTLITTAVFNNLLAWRNAP